jgi:hypothetical protein
VKLGCKLGSLENTQATLANMRDSSDYMPATSGCKPGTLANMRGSLVNTQAKLGCRPDLLANMQVTLDCTLDW